MSRILIIDDEVSIRGMLRTIGGIKTGFLYLGARIADGEVGC